MAFREACALAGINSRPDACFRRARQPSLTEERLACRAALVRVLPRAFGGKGAERFARLVGCDVTKPEGHFPEEGSAIVGFRVARCEPTREIVLRGRHRCSDYALTFRLDALADGTTRVRAETRARFPGAGGKVYRAAVIGTRGHVLVVRRLLRGVARRAERGAS